jgi:hypothetical protein
MGKACNTEGEKKHVYMVVVVGKPEAKILLRRPSHRQDDNITLDL